MAVCTVTLTTDKAAMSGEVIYEPFPGQIISGTFIDGSWITAQASGTSYIAALNQNVKYRIIAPRFPFNNAVFTTPASSTADLDDYLEGFRAG